MMNNMYAHLLISLILFHSSSFAIAAGDFDYIEASAKGPAKWGQLKPEWSACKAGKLQSPINIPDETPSKVTQPSPLTLNYKPSQAKIRNFGHVIQVEWTGDAGSIQINGKDYLLRSCHWHISSEHALNGQRFGMELHVVHQFATTPNDKAVIGILYQSGASDPFISKIASCITSITKKPEGEKTIGNLDPKEIVGDCKSFFRYTGSLTTPPCTEGVIWTVQKKVRTASTDQINLLMNAVEDNAKMNARPLQADNGREIQLFEI